MPTTSGDTKGGAWIRQAVAGGVAGLLSRFVIAPLDVIKIRYQVRIGVQDAAKSLKNSIKAAKRCAIAGTRVFRRNFSRPQKIRGSLEYSAADCQGRRMGSESFIEFFMQVFQLDHNQGTLERQYSGLVSLRFVRSNSIHGLSANEENVEI